MVPDAYYKSIFDIDYKSIKDKGIKNLFFDVDNTLVPYTLSEVDTKTINFINELKKDFNIIIVSNSMSNRVLKIAKDLDVKGYYTSMKPLKKTYKKILKEYKLEESLFIGDQFMTDILGAKRNKCKVLLVDRLLDKEPIVTKFWRFFEKIVIKKYNKKGLFKTYNYYDNIK
ncbi:MAG: YqeG family HAD IIIA-type phosphatase [Bacilli bacterium]|nr:YqeG family HAD IIIA-type phosphatase [Bacilli bacterium]